MIYFDNASTTAPCPAAIEAFEECTIKFGNPSSVHRIGMEAADILKSSRQIIAKSIGAKPSEIIFAPSGTFANNLAILGSVKARRRKGKHVVISDSEHPSVYNTAMSLKDEGYEISTLSTKSGKIDVNELRGLLRSDTVLVSIMMTNNETGANYPISELFAEVKKLSPYAVTHCDAVQAYMKTPINVSALKTDLLSISSHKIHSFKGSGALYINSSIRLEPITYGGGQERSLACGTESIPCIYAFAKAAQAQYGSIKQNLTSVTELYKYAAKLLTDAGCTVNTPSEHSPYVLSVTVPNIKSEVLLNYLSGCGIYISAGSACSSHAKENRVLAGFGLNKAEIDSTVRISFDADNTNEQVDCLENGIRNAINTLAKIKR